MIAEIRCPCCGHVNEYDTENDTLLCDVCDTLIFVDDETTEQPSTADVFSNPER
jgi:hypothetical protein